MDRYILSVIKKENFENVEKLVEFLKNRLHLPEQEILERILYLQTQGKLTFKEPIVRFPESFINYIFSYQVYWYWITILLASSSTLSTFIIPENAYPAVYARYLLGTIFIWILPGYTFVKALFPSKVPVPTSSTELDLIERVALSIGMSIVIVILNGFILNYTPFGIRTPYVTLNLLVLTTIFATVAIIREHEAKLKENNNTFKTHLTANNARV
jgi:hypothetical protein